MHEVPPWDLLNGVFVLEYPGGSPVVRGLEDWVIAARKDDCWHRDLRLQWCGGYGREGSVIAERGVQARWV